MPEGKRRGRPKSDAKNRQIFAAAVELFSQQGYEQTRIAEVAAAAATEHEIRWQPPRRNECFE